MRAVAGDPVGERLAPLAGAVAALGRPRRTPAVEADPQLMDYAERGRACAGPVIAAPLTIKERMVGVIVVGRLGEAPFGEADLRLLVTFADQTATAIENARLYTEVRAFSEVLEARVRARTAELEKANTEIERTLRELGDGAGAAHSLREDGRARHAGRRHRARGELARGRGAGAGRCAAGDGAASQPVRAAISTARAAARIGHGYFKLVDGLVPEMMTAPLLDVDRGAPADARG